MLPRFLFLAAIIFAVADSKQDTKLHFTLYTTSKCVPTQKYITDQVFPTYLELQNYLNISFIPWGKSTRDEDGTVNCRFGSEDCTGNKIQSCALYLLGNNLPKKMNYMNCEMLTQAATKEDYQCAFSVQLATDIVKECYANELGDVLQQEDEEVSKKVPIPFTPTVKVGNEYNIATHMAAYKSFKRYVCLLLWRERPEPCEQYYV